MKILTYIFWFMFLCSLASFVYHEITEDHSKPIEESDIIKSRLVL